jgi:hypothetical protein
MYVIPRGGGGGKGNGGRGKGEVCCSAKGESKRDELGPNQGAIRVIEGGPVRIPAPKLSFVAAGSVGLGAAPCRPRGEVDGEDGKLPGSV